MKCPKCGHDNSDSSHACSNCYFDLKGAAKPVAPPPVKSSTRVAPPPPVPTGAASAPQGGGPGGPGFAPPGAGDPIGAFPGPGYTPPVQHMDYAGFWARFAACFIDGILMGIVGYLVMMLMGTDLNSMIAARQAQRMPPTGASPELSPETMEAMKKMQTVQGINQLIGAVYSIGMNASRGATVGKMALGMKIVTVDGAPIGIGRAIGRYVLLPIFFVLTCGLGSLTIAFTARKQGIHDMIMGTVVVYDR